MSRIQLEMTANTDGAVQGLRSARSEVEGISGAAEASGASVGGLTSNFRGLSRAAPDAGRGLSMVEQTATGAARSMGVGATQVRILQVAIRTLTGALGPVTIALGALAVAIALVQRHQQAARDEADRLAEAQERAGEAAERHRQRLQELRDGTEDAARVMRDMQIEIMRLIDAERAREMVAEDVAQLAADARLVEIESLEDLVAASEETTAARARLAAELAQEEIRFRQMVAAAERAWGAAEIERANRRVIESEQRRRQIREELGLLDQQEQAIRRMFPLMRQLREVEEEADTARVRRISSIREETSARDALLAKIKEEAEAIAAAEAEKRRLVVERNAEQKEAQIQAIEDELEADRLKKQTQIEEEREHAERMLEIHLDMIEKRKQQEAEAAALAADAQRRQERLALAAADRMAFAVQQLATRSFREAVGSIGGQLQAEGVQYGFRGAAMALLGDPRGLGLAGIGAGMTTAGTTMRALAGSPSTPAVSTGAVAPASSSTVNQNASVNISIQEGLVSDPQSTAQRVSDAMGDVLQRGLWPEGVR